MIHAYASMDTLDQIVSSLNAIQFRPMRQTQCATAEETALMLTLAYAIKGTPVPIVSFLFAIHRCQTPLSFVQGVETVHSQKHVHATRDMVANSVS